MGIVDDIRNVFRAGADISDKLSKFNTRSIARGAMEQSFMFSVLGDDSCPVSMMSVMLQQLDRVYGSWTQIYLSSVGLIDLNYIKNPRQFIAKYQPAALVGESGEAEDYIAEGCDEALRDGLVGDDELLFASTPNKNGDHYLAIISPATKGRPVSKNSTRLVLEGYNDKPISGKRVFMEAPELPTPEDIVRSAIENQANSQAMRDSAGMLRATVKQAPKMLDNDAKKLNDMQPYVIELRLLAVKGDSSMSEWVNFSVGVKAWLHLGQSDRIKAAIVDTLRNRNPIFNFIKWTTGEISLIKDIILHLDDINFDVANKSDRTGKFISTLKEFKKKHVKIGSFGVNRLAPFATIVISSSTYYDIKDKYGYDIKNMAFAKKIMNELFLMCFIIIDDANHTYDILVDGQADFQTYSLETLEREVALKSSKLSKELTRMLGSN